MKNNTFAIRIFVSLVAVLFTLLPVQVTLCQAAAETSAITLPVEQSAPTGDTEKKAAVSSSTEAVREIHDPEAEESSMSTGLKIGIGVGAAVLVGVAVAAGGGGGGGDDTPAVPIGPPTADSLVGAWSAQGNQPGSGLTYTGTYHLYQGGSLGYDLNISDGQHLVGSGSWRINGYQLDIHTDHGSLYSGSFAQGVYNVVHMNANTDWNLTISR